MFLHLIFIAVLCLTSNRTKLIIMKQLSVTWNKTIRVVYLPISLLDSNILSYDKYEITKYGLRALFGVDVSNPKQQKQCDNYHVYPNEPSHWYEYLTHFLSQNKSICTFECIVYTSRLLWYSRHKFNVLPKTTQLCRRRWIFFFFLLKHGTIYFQRCIFYYWRANRYFIKTACIAKNNIDF